MIKKKISVFEWDIEPFFLHEKKEKQEKNSNKTIPKIFLQICNFPIFKFFTFLVIKYKVIELQKRALPINNHLNETNKHNRFYAYTHFKGPEVSKNWPYMSSILYASPSILWKTSFLP